MDALDTLDQKKTLAMAICDLLTVLFPAPGMYYFLIKEKNVTYMRKLPLL